MITTTLNRIRAHGPCRDGWEKLLTGLGKTTADDEPLPFARIIEINGLNDAVWCCRAEPQYAREWRFFAVWCVRQVDYLLTDPRSRDALVVAELHANGKATNAELDAARNAAWDASDAADAAARAAARAAAWDAEWAACAAALDAADAAATTASADASDAADAAVSTARAAAWDAARDAQKAEFLRAVCVPPPDTGEAR